ncbi:hypothetical protein ACIBI9_29330 [Nonomuraea sp. NPDC050451]|uniref:hypothetical protein n=1 Tax=Nonomuraea sp. NPDC050451 TaxID=3364364 RepID=UPI0037BD616C
MRGSLLIVSSPDGRLLRVEPDGAPATHADLGHGTTSWWTAAATPTSTAADGSLSNRRIWAELGEGTPDGRALFVVAAEWQGMIEPDLVVPGSGRVLTVEVEVPGAGRP